MKLSRNDLCTCGSGKKYKKCCLNWHENWATSINNFECDKEVKEIIRGAFDFIVEHDYRGGCHLISAIIYILLAERSYNPILKIGEVVIDHFVFDHSWVELEGEVIDIAIMNTLEEDVRFPPVLYGKSITTGKKVEYQYGVSGYLDDTAESVHNKSIGQYIIEGTSHGSIEILKLISKNVGIQFDNIDDTVRKYLATYRVKVDARSV